MITLNPDKRKNIHFLGKTTSYQYKGGCVFVATMSSYVYVEHQIGYSSTKIIRAKENFEQLALEHGIIVEKYLSENGLFKVSTLVQHMRDHNQRVQYFGVNTHHKNSVTERIIRTVSEIARTMMLHTHFDGKMVLEETYGQWQWITLLNFTITYTIIKELLWQIY